jgi:hypothetical protein
MFTQEASPLGYVKDAVGYIEDPKTAAQAEKGYAHKTQGFLAAELLGALHTLVLPCSSWTYEEIPLGSATSCSTDSSFAAPCCVD